MKENSWRAELLLSHLVSPVRENTEAAHGAEEMLERLLDEGARAHPNLTVPPECVIRHIADALHARADEAPAEVLARIPADDVYLAAACGQGDAGAIAAFCAQLFPPTRASLAKLGADDATIDEVLQRLRITLFVGDTGRQRQIGSYSARGRLRSWVRTIAVRTCRRLMGTGHGDDAAALENLPIAGDDPEIELLKEQYGEQFRASFRAALAALSDRERNVLRQHYIDGLSIDKLGTLYRVHRATAARWVSRARRALLDTTRTNLVTELGIQTIEVDSIIRLVRSQLDISIHDFLG